MATVQDFLDALGPLLAPLPLYAGASIPEVGIGEPWVTMFAHSR